MRARSLAPSQKRRCCKTPIALRGVTARNRIVVSPMSQYPSVDGAPTDCHLVHFGKFAIGGAGIAFVEETTV